MVTMWFVTVGLWPNVPHRIVPFLDRAAQKLYADSVGPCFAAGCLVVHQQLFQRLFQIRDREQIHIKLFA